ncbi:hypothetical protein C3942_00830 [Solimonas fluminis]|uniref:Phage gp6-like head-tail connector protein n=1 Tax=Solimonas fluminis TaxID=2086571 RepID=A0A2S5TKE5_9GAMM|nr:head-tail connector protein [Solimonas fluminis]PPE75470.1 hypothetical protein C3942_00830 [Solimonas fluminis]
MSTPNLVTLEEARQQVRLDADLLDENLALYIQAASEQCVEFLGRPLYLTAEELAAAQASTSDREDDPNAMVVNGSIRAACLLIVADLYRFRENRDQSPINQAATNLLWKFRVGLGV